MEEQIRAMGIDARGKSIFPICGELLPEDIAECCRKAGILKDAPSARANEAIPDLPIRSPLLLSLIHIYPRQDQTDSQADNHTRPIGGVEEAKPHVSGGQPLSGSQHERDDAVDQHERQEARAGIDLSLIHI